MKSKITVVGLGPGSVDYLSFNAYEKINKTVKERLFFRTDKHPTVDWLKEKGLCFNTFDDYYDKHDTFEGVYENIVGDLTKEAKNGDLVYAVPGSPFVAEKTVQLLIEKSKGGSFDLDFIPAASFVDAVLAAVRKDPVMGVKIVDGLQIRDQLADTRMDTLITQVYDRYTASEVKLSLSEFFGDEHLILVVRAAGIDEMERIEEIPVYELDHLDYLDHLTSVYVPALASEEKENHDFFDLLDIMARLRGENGCPWDRKQTHESIRNCMIEEAYEVVDAIDKNDYELMAEELGDVLLQVVFHSRMAEEKGIFDIGHVIEGICTKLIRRHPHVFGDEDIDTANKVKDKWEEIKREEKAEKTHSESMKRVPGSLPALMKSAKIQKKAAKVGFDWEDVGPAFDKIREETDELLEVLQEPVMSGRRAKEEIGDLIFAVVNVARFLKIDPEEALNSTVDKFVERFSYIESRSIEKGMEMKEMSLEEMDLLWEEAKILKNG